MAYDGWRVAIIVLFSVDASLLLVGWCLHHKRWTANDLNVWWLLLGWSVFGLIVTADNLIHDRPAPGWRTITLTCLALLTAYVALGVMKRPPRRLGINSDPRRDDG